jgi:hypothetical protein
MANRILTSQEFVEQILKTAREQVDRMPIEAVEILAKWGNDAIHLRDDAERQIGIGMGGAIGVCLIIAARERLSR